MIAPPKPEVRKWKELATADWIVCPTTGQVERIVEVRKYARGRLFVRTSCHDHFPPPTNTVTLAADPRKDRA